MKTRTRFVNLVVFSAVLLAAVGMLLGGCGTNGDPDPGIKPPVNGQGNGGTVTPPIPPAAKLAAVKIELPKPLFIGTPKNISVPNLQKADVKAPVILAPPGTKNVALGKTVTSDETDPFPGELKQITDGDKEGVDGSYVELGIGTQYVQIDLGAVHEIYGVTLWHFHQEGRVYFDVVVQVADDPDFITGVKTVFNNDNDNSSGLGAGKDQNYVDEHKGKIIDAKRVKSRYVRLYSNGNTSNESNHYIEVEVFGTPVK